MAQVSYQTIRLAKGKHSSPEHGACVMELASMLAGEEFTDHPRSVSRPLAAFLRGYNDLIDDDRRQDLYPVAAKAVRSAGPPSVEEARARRLIAWGDDMWELRASRRLLHSLRWPRPRKQIPSETEAAGTYAVHAIPKVCDQTHRSVLALLDELIAIGSATPTAWRAEPVVTEAGARAGALGSPAATG